jgi:hypothetical protein
VEGVKGREDMLDIWGMQALAGTAMAISGMPLQPPAPFPLRSRARDGRGPCSVLARVRLSAAQRDTRVTRKAGLERAPHALVWEGVLRSRSCMRVC